MKYDDVLQNLNKLHIENKYADGEYTLLYSSEDEGVNSTAEDAIDYFIGVGFYLDILSKEFSKSKYAKCGKYALPVGYQEVSLLRDGNLIDAQPILISITINERCDVKYIHGAKLRPAQL